MHTGKIKKLVRDRGFGFIDATDGREIFFHQSSLVEADFKNLSEDQPVEFEVEKSPKGPRAINIRIAQPAQPAQPDQPAQPAQPTE
ncbi:MAG: cold-shock protein [Candidatus Omnitrophica bacterium CG07_land_8_20_14_0_80_42_15]|uniref:Cold-shock protein n=1 Tax=Candidatus Aquitaenariimonas noxiae TaxID=1974741 RepID=A0A2J0L5B4_9BACT|nr:MAG: cold-shock protein [Candidatus Omnitrophica bacterium CG07_land_8_20_14_0_80_42_15]